jgi:hypothetical protein
MAKPKKRRVAPWYAIADFRHVILPTLLPALITGFSLAFSRGIGEYGSVVFVSGNMPYKTEIAPILIVARLEEFAYGEATAIAVVLLVVSFALLVVTSRLERWSMRHDLSCHERAIVVAFGEGGRIRRVCWATLLACRVLIVHSRGQHLRPGAERGRGLLENLFSDPDAPFDPDGTVVPIAQPMWSLASAAWAIPFDFPVRLC